MKISKNLFLRIWNQHIIDKKMEHVDLQIYDVHLSSKQYTLYSKKEKALVEKMAEVTNEINYDLDKVFQFFVANPGKIIDVEHILKMLQLKQHEKWQNPTDDQYKVISDYIKDYFDDRLTVISENEIGFHGYMFINNQERDKIRNGSSDLIKNIE